jgi:hypothetical protein
MRVSELVAEEDTHARLTGRKLRTPHKNKGGEELAAFGAHARVPLTATAAVAGADRLPR